MVILRRILQLPPHLMTRRRFTTSVSLQQKGLTLPRLPIFEALASHPKEDTAVIHSVSGKRFSYGNLLIDTARYKDHLLELNGAEAEQDLREKRIAFLVENGYDYVVSILSIFASGGIAVPLCTSHPTNEMRYVISDSTPSLLIASQRFLKQSEAIFASSDLSHFCNVDRPAKRLPRQAEDIDVKLVDVDWMSENICKERGGRGALIVYTSGTTNLPKGVLSTHKSVTAQSKSLVSAWRMDRDHLLHVLPLHHIHGIVNATFAPLFSGGIVEYLFPFNATAVWERLAAGLKLKRWQKKEQEMVSLFMAVPTVYNRLLATFPTLSKTNQERGRNAISALRLAISGSAALPGSLKDQWHNLIETEYGGGTILERYGMTEIGMALSQRLPLSDRMSNSVGWPLPSVEVRLVDTETGKPISAEETEKEGEIQIRGDTVFREYWNKPEATEKEFIKGEDEGNKWFKTGDIAVRNERGAYYIHGRASVDIIKSGGEKISALEVERELLELPQIEEAAVVALPDPIWGQKVAAIVVLTQKGKEENFGRREMRNLLKEKLARYKVPSVMKVVEQIKRNQMGKINKKTLVKEIFE